MTDFVIYGTPVSPFVRTFEALLGSLRVACDSQKATGRPVPEKVDLS